MQNIRAVDIPSSFSDKRFSIERASYKQMPLIAEFIRSSAAWYEKFLNEKDLQESHLVGQKWIDSNFFKREFYLGFNDEQVAVGTLSHQTFGSTGYLGYIFLDAAHVGKGYGRYLLDFAKSLSEAKDLKEMALIAHPEAVWATKAYEKFGFEKVATDKQEILSWNNNSLEGYYEEGFELYTYEL